METVKRGRKQGGWAEKFRCTGDGNDGGGCGAILLVSQADLYKTSCQSYGDTSPEYFNTFCCPECGVETDVEGVPVDVYGKRPSDKKRKAIAKKSVENNKNLRNKISIVLGSTSVHKLDAVRKACERLGMKASVSGINTASGQNEQPLGFSETFKGALTRAESVRARNPNAISIGIESGIFFFDGFFADMAVIVLFRSDGEQIVTISAGIKLPDSCVEIAIEQRKQEFSSATIGSVMAERFGGDPSDPHSTLTDGRVSRAMILTDALVLALGQI